MEHEEKWMNSEFVVGFDEFPDDEIREPLFVHMLPFFNHFLQEFGTIFDAVRQISLQEKIEEWMGNYRSMMS